MTCKLMTLTQVIHIHLLQWKLNLKKVIFDTIKSFINKIAIEGVGKIEVHVTKSYEFISFQLCTTKKHYLLINIAIIFIIYQARL